MRNNFEDCPRAHPYRVHLEFQALRAKDVRIIPPPAKKEQHQTILEFVPSRVSASPAVTATKETGQGAQFQQP